VIGLSPNFLNDPFSMDPNVCIDTSVGRSPAPHTPADNAHERRDQAVAGGGPAGVRAHHLRERGRMIGFFAVVVFGPLPP
jgi:hypothetical protein